MGTNEKVKQHLNSYGICRNWILSVIPLNARTACLSCTISGRDRFLSNGHFLRSFCDCARVRAVRSGRERRWRQRPKGTTYSTRKAVVAAAAKDMRRREGEREREGWIRGGANSPSCSERRTPRRTNLSSSRAFSAQSITNLRTLW